MMTVGRFRLGRGVLRYVALGVIVGVLAGCGLATQRGVELGQLRDLARRVEGGGAECPLAVPARLLRPSTVDRDEPVVALRVGGPGADGAVGKGLSSDDDVRITCRFTTGDAAITLDIVGVTRGHAIGAFTEQLKKRGDSADVVSFVDVNATLPIGRSSPLPGEPPAAFARVAAAQGDIALVLSVEGTTDTAKLPPVGEVEERASAIALDLAD